MPVYRRRSASENVEDSTVTGIRIYFRESDGTDACVFEAMSRLDVVFQAIRPRLKTGLFGVILLSGDIQTILQ
jgi:hypothetical protein